MRAGPRSRARRGLPGILAALAMALLVGCTSVTGGGTTSTSTDSAGPAETAVAQFVSAWQSGSVDQIAGLTSDPAGATDTVGTTIKNLQPSSITVTASDVRTTDGRATAKAHFVWSLPKGISWDYDADWALTSNSSGWIVQWAPTVLHPQLGSAQTIALRTVAPGTGQLLDRNDQQLVSPVLVHSVVALPGKVGDPKALGTALSKLLTPYDATVTAASVVTGVQQADPQAGYTVTNLRDTDFQKVKAQLEAIPGLTFPQQTRNLPPTKDFAKILLSQATPVAQKLMAGAAGWRIVTLDTTGAELATLASQNAVQGQNVVLTIDSSVQQAAESVIADVAEPTVLVAIQPSTGEVLAVAQNAAANAAGPIALTGEYEPGSTFKIVTATAAFESGLVTPDSEQDCPSYITVDGREIHNSVHPGEPDGFDLGTVPVRTAFAESCNTTFAHLSTQLAANALPDAAEQYSIGLDFVIPGITTLTGKIQAPDSVAAAAEAGFGQGTDLLTPFSAAMMAATVAHGSMPTPVLIRGQRTTVDRTPTPLSSGTIQDIRGLMRAVVTEGTAGTLAKDGEVYAKTGTADNAGPRAHAWCVGYRGDVAFAALIVGGNTSGRTTILIDNFLQKIGSS